jgi:phage-related protein
VRKKRKYSTKFGTLSQLTSRQELHQVAFYCLSSGREPVRDWLKKLDPTSRKMVGEDLYTLQLGWPVGMPLARKIEAGLWEQRSKIVNGIARIIFTENTGRLILLHGFIKKSQKLPDSDLKLARQRLSTVRRW